MYIGAALLCQAYIAPLSLFLALMPSLCHILKTLLKIEGFSSDSETYNAGAREAAGDYNGGEHSPSPSVDTRAEQPKGT